MKIFPAIDLFGGKAVRLFKGNYNEMTVYSDYPEQIANDFYNSGAKCMHVVDLEGAKSGETPNIETIKKLVSATPAFVEVGGGIRSMAVIEKYLSVGVDTEIVDKCSCAWGSFALNRMLMAVRSHPTLL